MIEYTDILKAHPELVQQTINFFTAQSTNPKSFSEIKAIGIKWAKHFKKPNAETFVNMGYLSVFDFQMYLNEKKLIGKGVKMGVVDLILKILEEKLIISPVDKTLTGIGDKRYQSNGVYTKHLYDNDLIDNVIFGFNYIISNYQKSVVKIENIDKNKDASIGTGFLIEDEDKQLIITNKHVLEKAVKLRLLNKDDVELKFETPYKDENSDLAILPLSNKIESPNLQLNLSLEILSEIITIGYPSIPMTKFSYQIYHKGEINSFVEDYFGNKLFLISAKTSSGNSGSPVIDKTGLVVGIITEELFEKELFNKKGKLPYYAAIPAEEIVRVINEYKKVANNGE